MLRQQNSSGAKDPQLEVLTLLRRIDRRLARIEAALAGRGPNGTRGGTAGGGSRAKAKRLEVRKHL
jgi:hypothetical protein